VEEVTTVPYRREAISPSVVERTLDQKGTKRGREQEGRRSCWGKGEESSHDFGPQEVHSSGVNQGL